MLTPMMLNFILHLLARCLPPPSTAIATQLLEQHGRASTGVCKQLAAGAGVQRCRAAVERGVLCRGCGGMRSGL